MLTTLTRAAQPSLGSGRALRRRGDLCIFPDDNNSHRNNANATKLTILIIVIVMLDNDDANDDSNSSNNHYTLNHLNDINHIDSKYIYIYIICV